MLQNTNNNPSNSILEEVLAVIRREMTEMRREIADLRTSIVSEWRGELSEAVQQQNKMITTEISLVQNYVKDHVNSVSNDAITKRIIQDRDELESVILRSSEQMHDRILHIREEWNKDLADLRSQTRIYVDGRLSHGNIGIFTPDQVKAKNSPENVGLNTTLFPRVDSREESSKKESKKQKQKIKKKKSKKFRASRLVGQPDGSDPSDSSSSSSDDTDSSSDDGTEESEESLSELDDRRNSLANRVRFRNSKKVQSKNYEVIMTQAKPTCSSKLSFVNARNAFKFCMDLDIFEQKENVKLTWSSHVEESAARQIQRKNKNMIPTLPAFYRLTNKQVFKAIRRTCRPSGVDEFLKVLEDSVEFTMPNGKEASYTNYNYLYSQLYIFFDVFKEMFEFLLDGCKFQKELSYDDKPGSIVRIFIDKVSKETDYLQKVMKGSKTKSFDDLEMFYRFLRKRVEEHKYFAMHNSIISRTFFSSKSNKSETDAPKRKFFQKRLNYVDVNNVQDYEDDFVGDSVPTVLEEASETEYYEEMSGDDIDGQISQQQSLETNEEFTGELNAVVPTGKTNGPVSKFQSNTKGYGGVGFLRKPDSSIPAKEPAACWEFSVYNRCARGDRCTFSHKTEHCSKFLEEIMSKGADRLKVLKSK